MSQARFRFLSFLMPFVLLLAQLGAARHEIGHLQFIGASTEATAQAGVTKKTPIDKLCETCLSFAHLSASAAPEVPTVALLRFEHQRAPADAVHAIAADAPALRSRGPPTLL